MFKKISQPFLGFLQATGLVTYIFIVAVFFLNIEEIFNNVSSEFMAPIIMLLLFVISAVISALLVLGRAGVLFWEKRYSESLKLVLWTIGWAAFYFVLCVTLLFVSY